MKLCPVTLAQANEFVAKHHRHNQPVVGWKFGVGVTNGNGLVGVAIVGRPVARHMDDGMTLEVTRCCTDGTPNACSKLYSAAWRAARAMGYQKLVTYVLASESGNSLKASGYKLLHKTAGGSWDCPSRPREDKAPVEPKQCWGCEHITELEG